MRVRKKPAALYFAKIYGLRAFYLVFFFFCRRIPEISAESSLQPKSTMKVLLDCIFLTLKSVECASDIPNSSYPLNSRHNQDSCCQTKMSRVAEGSKSEANQLWAFSSSLLSFFSNVALKRHSALPAPPRVTNSTLLFVFALSNFSVIFLVLYFSLKHCPTMNINQAENINSPSVLSISQAWLK